MFLYKLLHLVPLPVQFEDRELELTAGTDGVEGGPGVVVGPGAGRRALA